MVRTSNCTSAPPVQLTGTRTIVNASQEEITNLRNQFQSQNWVRLQQLLSASLLERVTNGLVNGEFYERVHKDIGANKELCLKPDITVGMLDFVHNSRDLFDFLQAITDCGHIGCFGGRVYRFQPTKGHFDAWHDDMEEDKLLALSINLSPECYEGGLLELRNRGENKAYTTVSNTGPGDAIIFRLSDSLEHRVSEVTGTCPKTAYAGWFRSKTEFGDKIKNLYVSK